MHHHFIITLPRSNTLHHVPSHRNVELDLEIRQLSHASGYVRLHDRSSIYVPEESPSRLVPAKSIHMALRAVGGVVLRVDDAVLVVIFAIVLAPVETGVIYHLRVPRLHHVNLTVRRPA